MEQENGPRTYGNWRKPTSPGIFGLGSYGTIAMFGYLIFLIILLMLGRWVIGLVFLALGFGLLLVIKKKDRDGKSILSRVSSRLGYMTSKSKKSHLYRSGPLSPNPWGEFQLPGILANSELWEFQDSYNRPFALLYTPGTSSYSVIFSSSPDGASEVDQETIDRWVADWGHWLSNIADESSIEGVSVTIETAPDSGTRLASKVLPRIDGESSELGQETLRRLVNDYPTGSSVVKSYITLTFSAYVRIGGHRRSFEEMGYELASRIPALTSNLQHTGAGVAFPVTAQELCEMVRVAYDPAASSIFDIAKASGERPEISWNEVGPTAHEATWDDYFHDSGHSKTWSMTVAPRGIVQSQVLARLLAPHPAIARKRVTMHYRPIDVSNASEIVESDLNAAKFAQTTTKSPTASSNLNVRAAEATAYEQSSGAALYMFGMSVTATVMNGQDIGDASAAIDELSGTARLRLRPVYGSQDSAFAATLPLGLIMPKHLSIPSDLRNKL